MRARPLLLPAMLLAAFWLPGMNAGWYRTDTHYYAAIAKQAWDTALEQRSFAPLLDLKAGDLAYMNKPPLVFIIEGAFIRAFGLDVWSVRLPSLLGAIVLVMAAAWSARRIGGARLGVLAGLVAATTLEVFRYTRAVSLDLWMSAFIVLAVAYVVSGLGWRGEDRKWRVVLAGVPLGLALLCKPMVALLALPLLAAWLIWIGRGRLAVWLIPAGVTALIVAAPWHAWMALRHDEFIDVYFRQQSLDRVTQGMMDVGVKPWWYYLVVIGEGYWPWAATFAIGCVVWWKRRGTVNPRDAALLRLSVVWSIGWLLVLSLAAGKYSRYLLVAWPLAAYVSAWMLARAKGSAKGRTMSRGVVLWLGPGAMVACAILAIVIPGKWIHAPRERVWDDLAQAMVRYPEMPMYVDVRVHHVGAQVVMLGGEWPRTIGDRAVQPYVPGRSALVMLPVDAPNISGEREVVAKGQGVRVIVYRDAMQTEP